MRALGDLPRQSPQRHYTSHFLSFSCLCDQSGVGTARVDRVIIEHTANDSYWGDGGVRDWCESMPGNELGKLLMRIRGELIARGTVSQFPLPNLTG